MKSAGLEATEAQCADGRTAPRVSVRDIENNIEAVYHLNAAEAVEYLKVDVVRPLRVLHVCLIVLRNGFTLVGKAAPASEANYDENLGRTLAYEDAVRQAWPLMGYALRERLMKEKAEAEHGGD